MEDALVWTASNGSTIRITVVPHLDRAIVDARVDGRLEPQSVPSMLDAPISVGDRIAVARVGQVGITQDQLDWISAAMTAVQQRIDAQPEVRMRKLVTKRNGLVEDIDCIADAAHEAGRRDIENTSRDGFSVPSSRDFQAEERLAREALADFDAAHPEVAAKLQVDRRCAAERFLASN